MLALFALYTQLYALPPGLLSSLCYVESRHMDVVNYNDGKGHSYGICQIKLSTARDMGFKGNDSELRRPENNIHYAARYLQYQYKRCGSYSAAVTGYNSGSCHGKLITSYWRKVFTQWSLDQNT